MIQVGDQVRLGLPAFIGLRRSKTFSSDEMYALILGGRVVARMGAAVEVVVESPTTLVLKVWSGYLVKIV